jgi:hypothetical protein
MKLKLDANGNVVMQDGKPVYVMDGGQEVAFDAPATVATISRLNAEAKGHRERAEKAEVTLKNFAGIEDPDAARQALQTIKNFDQKKLVDAGKVEEVRQEAVKAADAKYAPIAERAKALEQKMRQLQIGGSFARSEFVKNKLLIPSDLVEARFGSSFSLEGDDKIVAKDRNGNIIYSPARPGEPADFEEALAILVDQYPQKASILKGDTGGGGGKPPSSESGSAATGKKLSRAQFETLTPEAKMTHTREGGLVV